MSPRPEAPDSDMSEAKRRFFSGDTLRQALVQAANHYNVDPDRVAYRSIEKRHGFLKNRRRVVIEVDPDAPQLPAGATAPRPEAPLAAPVAAAPQPSPPPVLPAAPAAVSPAPRTERERPAGGERRREREVSRREIPRPVLPPVAPPGGDEEGLIALPERPLRPSERFPPAAGPQADAARQGLDLLLGIAGLDLSTRIHQGEDRLEIELSGPGAERCFDDEGELLMAIEHLLPRVIRSLSGEAVPCRVDCDNFHEIREEQLRTLAQRAAEEVRRRGRPRTLEPMNPADRRVVHMTLADDPHVETESEGEGYFKRITIRPS
jgi:spoIIIJ-associated protein